MNNLEKTMQYLASIYLKDTKDGNHQQRYYRKQLKKDFDEIIEKLPSVLAMILQNDYLSPVEEDWWKYLYSKRRYCKLKNIAINAFFDCLYI